MPTGVGVGVGVATGGRGRRATGAGALTAFTIRRFGVRPAPARRMKRALWPPRTTRVRAARPGRTRAAVANERPSSDVCTR